MNDDTANGGLGYDPCDRHSFPYQQSDPPFDATSLTFDAVVLDQAPDLDAMEVITEMLNYDDDDLTNFRQLDMALRLFYKISGDSAYNDIAFPDLFGACCLQAMIWERG